MAKMSSNIAHRRKVRELEAKRDALLSKQTTNKSDLAKVRAELKVLRSRR